MEIWKEVRKTNGKYSVSNKGNVKNKKGHIMKPIVHRQGYLYIDLSINGKKTKGYIHKMVAEEFIKNEFNKPQVNHIDLNKTNNNVKNLEWVTCKENQEHSRNNQKYFNPQHNKSNISYENVMEIKRLYKMNTLKKNKEYSYRKLSSMYNVSVMVIQDIIKCKGRFSIYGGA